MSANTSEKGRNDTKLMFRYTALMTNAARLIAEAKRSDQMLERFVRAHQLFKENRLGLVLPAEPLKPSDPNLFRALSLTLREAGMDHKLQRFFGAAGMLYVGEIYRFPWHFQASAKHPQGRVRAKAEAFLAELQLPPSLDLNAVDWIPPYLDENLRRKMGEPAINVLRAPTSAHSERDPDYRLYRWAKNKGSCVIHLFVQNRSFESLRQNLTDKSLHAGMWIPKLWFTQTENVVKWNYFQIGDMVAWNKALEYAGLSEMIKRYGEGPFMIVALRLHSPTARTLGKCPVTVTIEHHSSVRQEFDGAWFAKA